MSDATTLDIGPGDVHQPGTDGGKKKKKRKRTIRVSADIAHGGSLSVRHMSDGSMALRWDVVDLDPVAALAAEGPASRVWIQLAKPGHFRGHAAGPFTLDAKVFSEIVDNFHATANKAIPIDFEHASEADPTQGEIARIGAPAQGWVVDLKIEGGNLWGLVEWGSLARDYIKSGAYKFFSPAIRFNSKDRVTGKTVGARMTSGALTNNPFLDGMQAMAAKDASTVLCVLECCPACADSNHSECTEGACSCPCDPEPIARVTAPETATMSDQNNAELTLKLTAVETKHAEVSLKLKDAEQEIETLRKWKSDREEADISERVTEAFDTYKAAKKLTDADRDSMLIVCRANRATFDKNYPKVASDQKHLLTLQVGSDSAARDEAGSRSDGPAAEMTISSLTKKLMKDNPTMTSEGAREKAARMFSESSL